MRGLYIEGGAVRVRADLARPPAAENESRVRVRLAGVCATDLALQRGYMGFAGVPGHEFVGVALDGPLVGQRVVGEINAACGTCDDCRAQRERHCPHRSVLGILDRPGAFAEELSLPTRNLLPVPDTVRDEQAVFAEPLAAAFQIAEGVDLRAISRAAVIGDGRLGILCAQVLALFGIDVQLFGRHPERAGLLAPGVEHRVGGFEEDTPAPERFELVVEASGHPEVLPRALAATRPRGSLVLKTTAERPVSLDLAPLVVDEIRLIGSRCGRFAPALAALADDSIDVEKMITDRFELGAGPTAFERARASDALKVLIDVEADR